MSGLWINVFQTNVLNPVLHRVRHKLGIDSPVPAYGNVDAAQAAVVPAPVRPEIILPERDHFLQLANNRIGNLAELVLRKILPSSPTLIVELRYIVTLNKITFMQQAFDLNLCRL